MMSNKYVLIRSLTHSTQRGSKGKKKKTTGCMCM